MVKTLRLAVIAVWQLRFDHELLLRDEEITMFGSQSKKKKLEAKYRKLVEESRRLSTSNRSASDAKMAEADAVLRELQMLDQTN